MKLFKTTILLILLASYTQMQGQVTITLGTYAGYGSTNTLLSTSTTSNKYSRTMSIYPAAEILSEGGMAGNITSLAWDKSGQGEYTTNDAYIKVFLTHISASAWPSNPVPVWDSEVIGATEVFTSSTYSIPTGVGWANVPFTTPFAWNGVDNIVVMVEWYRQSAPTADINWGHSMHTNANACRVGSTSLAALVMLINNKRPMLQLTFAPTGPVTITGVTVSTQGSTPATISTDGGTLQMEASVQPVYANQAVTWDIVNGTGSATISSSGLVTAQSNGTVWAKATSVADSTMSDSLQINISGQAVPVTGINITTQGGVPASIATKNGTLQLKAEVIPSGANQGVIWIVAPVTGSATISQTGLVTAVSNGTVWGKAVSVQDNSYADSIEITISNQLSPVIGVSIQTQGGVPAIIDTKSGTLQMAAAVIPSGADQSIIWSVVKGSGDATIDTTGLVTAVADGEVWAKATSLQDLSKSDSLKITITNQNIGIDAIANDLELKIYPNPVTDGKLFIKTNLEIDVVNVEITDMSGAILLETELKLSDEYIDISQLSKGIYILRLDKGSIKSTYKFNVL